MTAGSDSTAARLAAALRRSKAALLAEGPDGHLTQVEPVELDGFAAPDVPDALVGRAADGPVIGMFVARADGSVTPMGIDDDLVAFWTPTAARVVGAVLDWCREHDVTLADDGYVTASLTTDPEISNGWHVDDDQIRPDDGIGVVAIASNGRGPRLTTVPVPITETRAGLPLDPDVDDAEDRPAHDVAPGCLVVFPQFGQVHRAPGPSGDPGFVRNLFVLRWATVPTG